MIRFSELVNLFLLTGAAVVLLDIIFKNNNAILWLDARLLLGCMLAMVLRLFILADSPVSNNIPVVRVFPEFYRFWRRTLFYFGEVDVSGVMILQAVWLCGAVVSGLYRIHEYRLTQKRIRCYRWLRDKEFSETVKRVNRELGKKKRFRLVISEELITPCIFGVFRPYIAVPDIEFAPEEIYLVVKHEMLHYYRGDLIIKILCEALKAVYWWDWFVYKLGHLIAEMQEINVDFRVVRDLPEMLQATYMGCLIRVARNRGNRKRKNQWEISFRKESPSEVHKRVGLMLKNQKIGGKKTTASFILSVGILCMIVIGPNMLTFEPYAVHDEDAVGNVGIRGGGICYLDNKDGTYDIYIDGQYFKTTKTLFDEDIPVYDSLEEAKGND